MDLRLFDRDCREHWQPTDPGARVERDDSVVRMIGPTADVYSNFIVFSRLNPESAERIVQREIEIFRGRNFEWRHYDHDPLPELPRILEVLGFVRQESETLQILEPERHIVPSTEFDVRAITPDTLQDVVDVQSAVRPIDFSWLKAQLAREMAHSPGSIRVFAAYVDGRPVSSAWIRFHGEFGALHGGSTLPAYRGRGIYRALVQRRLAAARDRGMRFVYSESTNASRPILERFGFRAADRTTPFFYIRG